MKQCGTPVATSGWNGISWQFLGAKCEEGKAQLILYGAEVRRRVVMWSDPSVERSSRQYDVTEGCASGMMMQQGRAVLKR